MKSLPMDPFDVVVHRNGQCVAAAHPAALQNFAAISSGHTLAETMYAHAPADFGLISAFGHSSSLSYSFDILV
jgi:hypothetical protein